jgi:hypothetical protein
LYKNFTVCIPCNVSNVIVHCFASAGYKGKKNKRPNFNSATRDAMIGSQPPTLPESVGRT